ncbi:MAG: hypothetical protein K6E63_10280 [Lachnospiraceae bacterium]|nr:hypothetical protein [Lachnospiraceae bacterium]
MDNKEKYMISDEALSNVSGGTELRDELISGRNCPYCHLSLEETDDIYKAKKVFYYCKSCDKYFDLALKPVSDPTVVVSNRAC